MIKHFVPEVTEIESQDDPFSTVDPFYSDPFGDHQADWDN